MGVIPLQFWQFMNNEVQQSMGDILLKCDFMERRLMKMQYSDGDVCRQVSSDVQSYNEKAKNPLWISRRLRVHYADWMQTVIGGPTTLEMNAFEVWSWVCTEVLLRYCRDVLAERWEYMKVGTDEPENTKMKNLKVMQRMQDMSQWCGVFWKTVQPNEWHIVEELEPTHYREVTLKSQLMERMEEIREYGSKVENCDGPSRVKKAMLENGLPPLAASFLQSSSSAGMKKLE